MIFYFGFIEISLSQELGRKIISNIICFKISLVNFPIFSTLLIILELYKNVDKFDAVSCSTTMFGTK